MKRIGCKRFFCRNKILQTTADQTGGYCMVCFKKRKAKEAFTSAVDVDGLNAFLKAPRADLRDQFKASMIAYLNQFEDPFPYGIAVHFNQVVGAGQVALVSNREFSLDDEWEDGESLCPDEWAEWDHDALNSIDPIIASYEAKFKAFCNGSEDTDAWESFLEKHEASYFQVFLDVLTELRKEAVPPGCYLVMWFSDFNHPVIAKSVKALNNGTVWKMFRASF